MVTDSPQVDVITASDEAAIKLKEHLEKMAENAWIIFRTEHGKKVGNLGIGNIFREAYMIGAVQMEYVISESARNLTSETSEGSKDSQPEGLPAPNTDDISGGVESPTETESTRGS